MTTALSLKNISYAYAQNTESNIISTLSLEVKKGDIICLLGASGCGKTTLLKMIAGLIPLNSGEVYINQRLVDDAQHSLPPEERNIGMIFQDYALFPHLTVIENITFGLRHLSKAERENRAKEMLALTHLTNFSQRYPHQLSGGQQQRVAIARSLAYHPDLLLLDEPFSNIDTQVRQGLINEIRQIFKQQGITAIFVTHSREEAFSFADKIAVMNQGKIEQYGTAHELYQQPHSRFVADFLGGGNYLEATRINSDTYHSTIGNVLAQTQQNIAINTLCELFIRPQYLQLALAPQDGFPIIAQQFMGDYYHYTIQVDKYALSAQSKLKLKIGEYVTLSCTNQGIIAFSI